jgi:hypothetical protein
VGAAPRVHPTKLERARHLPSRPADILPRTRRLEEESRRAHGAAQAECLETVESAQRSLNQELKALGERSDGEEDDNEAGA